MLSQVNHELEGSDGSTPPSSPIGWLVEENSIELEILQVMQWQSGGHALYHAGVDPLPLRNAFFHGRISLFAG